MAMERRNFAKAILCAGMISGGFHLMEAGDAITAGSGGKSLVAFGDSITRGYGVPQGKGWVELLPAMMKGKYGDKAQSVFNAGGNGNTSGEGLKRIDADVLSHMPGLVLVEFGGNDARHTAGGLSVDEFERNILEIHRRVKERGGEIALLTFPPIVNEWHAARNDPYYAKWDGLDGCVEEYRQRTRELAKRLGCPLFDLDKLLRKRMKGKGRDDLIAKDGVHLTVKANEIVAEAIFKFLREGF